MIRKKKKFFLYIGLIFCIIFSIYYSAYVPSPSTKSIPAHPEIHSGRYDSYVITDEAGTRELMRVRIAVNIGDEVLTEDNLLYEIIRIEKDHAYAKYVKQLKL